MKRLFLMIAVMAMAMAVMAQQYDIKGDASGLPDGTVLQIIPMSHDREKPIGETIVSNGKFEFKGTVAFPICVRLSVKDGYGGDTFMLDNIPIGISVNAVETGKEGNVPVYEFKDMRVTGSSLTDKLSAYKEQRNQLDQAHKDFMARHTTISAELREARMEKDKERLEKLEQSVAYKAMADDEKAFFAKVEETYTGIINENLDTYWGPMMAIYFYSYFTSEQAPLFNSFSKEAQESWYGQKMKDEIFPGGGAGALAKDLNVKDDEGRELTLWQLAEGMKVVLVDFWASWCGPCRKEIPNVKRQYALYKEKGLEVVSISIDKSEAAWRKALKEEELSWPNYIDRTGAADVYNVRSIPAMYLIDVTTRTIIASGEEARGEALTAKLSELFK